MADLGLGALGVDMPSIDLTGMLSSSWIYVFIVAVIGFFLIVGIGIYLFFKTYNRKIIVFENISGAGYQPVLRTRARIVKLGISGEEVLKTLAGGTYISAYGRKMGKNTYWLAKGSDGYLYNIVLGDLDTKLAMLDIEPIDRDVRMFHVALSRLAHSNYDKKNFIEKYGNIMFLFVFLVVLVLGMWFIIGKIGDATSALASTAKTNEKVVGVLNEVLQKTDNIKTGIEKTSGLVLDQGGG